MPVPRAVSMHPNLPVSIVLKADQATGKLTTGRIADILTRGDHPRGIKVRLQDGRIGRVQALGPSSGTADAAEVGHGGATIGGFEPSETLPAPGTQHVPGILGYAEQGISERSDDWSDGRRGGGYGRSSRRSGLQDDYRFDPQPPEERSLEDFVTFKAPRKKKGRRGGAGSSEADTASTTASSQTTAAPTLGLGERSQHQELLGSSEGTQEWRSVLQAEFPGLDSALVAAIAGDYESIEEAREVLRGISG